MSTLKILALVLLCVACAPANVTAPPPRAPSLTGMWSGSTSSGIRVSLTVLCLTEHDCAGQGQWGAEPATVVARYEHPAVRLTIAAAQEHQVTGEVIAAADNNVIMARVEGCELMLRR